MKKLIKKYAGTYTDRVITLSVLSAVVNLISAVVKLVIGIQLQSFWYIVNASYYITLVAARIACIVVYHRARREEEAEERIKTESAFYRRSGLFIFLLAFLYLILCVFMFTRQYAVVAEGYDAVIIVGIVIYKLIFSLYGLHMTRKLHDRVTETLKTISLTDAGVSLIAAMATILNFIDGNIAVKTSAALGIVISLAFMATGMVMTVTRTRKYRKAKTEEVK